jgi:cysteine desulfurase/selenocysteine lyase
MKKLRHDFPALDLVMNSNSLVYFDNAATTFKPHSVITAVENYYTTMPANVHRAVHTLSEHATSAYEGAREKVSCFINAASSSEIIFTKGTTESINLVANSFGASLKAGDEILITHMEHHSNIVPWQLLCERKGCVLKIAPITDSGEIDLDAFIELLGPRTKIVSVVHISNTLGTINPIEILIPEARKTGAVILIDAAQSIAHLPLDVQKLDCDFLAFSGHKIFGPTGIGVLYGKRELLEKMPPWQGGGDMILSVSFERTLYNELPWKFEAGTPPIAEAIGLGAAIDYVSGLGLDRIEKQEKALLAHLTTVLKKKTKVRLIGEALHKLPIASFVVDGVHPHDLGTFFDQYGIAVRTGHHCTEPLMKRFKVPATTRASLAFYNTLEEIDRFSESLDKALEFFA